MKKRVITGSAIVLALVLMFVLKIFVHPYFFDAFIYGITCFAGFETSKLLSKIGLYNHQSLAVIFPGALLISNILGMYFALNIGYIVLIDLGLALLFALGVFLWNIIYKGVNNEIKTRGLKISKAKFAFKKALGNFISFIYPSLFMMSIMFLNHIDELGLNGISNFNGNLSIVALLFMFLIPMFTDTFAMFSGMLFGGKKLCPKISPNKTISGAVGGSLWCVLLSACVYLILDSIDIFNTAFLNGGMKIWIMLIIVLIGSVIAQCGDIFESFLKRKADVKDSGKILPGHGGVLDRIDSYIFLAPFLVIAFILVVIL